MNRLKKYRGLIKKTWFATTGITLLVLLFGVPSFPRFQKTGDNFYKVSINGTEIGNSSDPEEVERLVAEARREITETEGTMVYIPVEITSEGQELLFGNTDSRHNLYKAIYDVLKGSISTTLQHAYTVKINEYTVNLGSSSDVRALLQAALDRYDTEHAYRADIVIDPDRQLNVLTTSVSKKDDSTGQLQHAAGEGAGAERFFDELFEEIEPDQGTVDFSQMEYGTVSVDFGDTVEIVDGNRDFRGDGGSAERADL